MCGQVARPLLGGGAGGRSPGVLAAGCVADRCDRLRCSEQSGSTVTAITVSPRFQLSGTEAGYGFTYNPPLPTRFAIKWNRKAPWIPLLVAFSYADRVSTSAEQGFGA
jgi:hypothetical protein